MDTLANVTVIRGKGACNVLVNGELSKEVCRINKLHEEEMAMVKNELKKTKDRMAMMPANMYKKELLAHKFVKLRFNELAEPSVLDKIRNWIMFVWACIWVYGIKFDMWGYWDPEEDARIRRELGGWRK